MKANNMNRNKTQQAALLETLIVAWVNENADRIKALAAMRQMTPAEMKALIEEFKAAQ